MGKKPGNYHEGELAFGNGGKRRKISRRYKTIGLGRIEANVNEYSREVSTSHYHPHKLTWWGCILLLT